LVNKSRPPAKRIGRPRTKVAWGRYGLQKERQKKEAGMYCNSQKDRDMLKRRREKEEKLEVLRKFREEQKLLDEKANGASDADPENLTDNIEGNKD